MSVLYSRSELKSKAQVKELRQLCASVTQVYMGFSSSLNTLFFSQTLDVVILTNP